MGIATKLRKIIKKEIIKKKKKDKTKRQIPRYRISILTRTANAVQYPTTELRGTCHAWRANLKIICNKWISYCKENVHRDCMEN